ncbi:MAG: FixH family protein [Pseudomonadota bacterium]
MSYADPTPAKGKELKGWHVLLIMLGFFGVIFAVNGVFLYHAITSHPGEIVEKSYLQGLNYNDRLETRALQAERGWTAAMGIEADTLVVVVADGDGRALSRLGMAAQFLPTASNGAAIDVPLTASGAGTYAADLSGVPSGTYEVDLRGYEGDAQTPVLEARKRLYVPE